MHQTEVLRTQMILHSVTVSHEVTHVGRQRKGSAELKMGLLSASFVPFFWL